MLCYSMDKDIPQYGYNMMLLICILNLQHDDPNAVISGILEEMRKNELKTDFSPASLKGGVGDNCILVLNSLASLAMTKKGLVTLQRPQPEPEDNEEQLDEPEEAELTVDQFEEEDPEAADDDEEDAGFLSLDKIGANNAGSVVSESQQQPRLEMIKSDTDVIQWKQEVERVMPSLKIVVRADAKDWRGRLEQLQTYRTSIKEAVTDTGGQLQKLANDIGRGLDKISSREKYLNQQLESLLSQFRTTQDRCAEVKEQYKEASTGVTERSRRLANITEELEQVKQTMEDRGTNLTDGAPLVKIKHSITRLQSEIEGMDVQSGVIEQALMQAQLKNRTNLQEDMYSIPQLDFGF